MTWKTHIVGGLQAGLIVAYFAGDTGTAAMTEIGIAMLGSVLPDIDHPSSKLSRSDYGLSLLSGAVSRVTSHRRGTHTMWCSFLFAFILFSLLYVSSLLSATSFPFLIAVAAALVIDLLGLKIGTFAGILCLAILPSIIDIPAFPVDKDHIYIYTAALFAGCIAHLIYDTFNPQGIMWLHPLTGKRFHLMNIQTGSAAEGIFGFVMALLAVAILSELFPAFTSGYVFR